MKRFFAVLVLILISLPVFSQIDVKKGSFHKIQGFVMTDKNDHYDVNDAPMSLIKITTENIDEEQRARFIFKGNAVTDFDVQKKDGQTFLYLSASATFIEIIHPDYGKTEYWFPEDLCDFCGYELVVVSKGSDDDETPQINYLIINTDQENAAIYIDGDYVGDKEVSRSFDIGTSHTWKIDCKLYHTESGEVTITSGDAVEINKTLRPAYGFINVTSQPESDAVVLINGERVGNTPYKSDKMPSGTYKVKLMKEMYDPVEETYVINDGKTTNADINMSANYVNATLTTDADSDIYLDNEFKAKGNWTGRVSLGVHYAEARKVNHKTSVQKIEFKKGDKTDVVLESPQPINGHLNINSTPMKADIYIDGKHYGTTPKIITNILIGNHKLRLEKEGCATLTKDIVVEEGKTLSLNEKLSTGKEIVVKTDKTGDKVYVDDDYIGDTPLTINLSYGKHSIKAVRGNQTATKDIDVKIDNKEVQEYILVFGKLISITSDTKGDDIYVDGEIVGQTPMDVDFSLGEHEVEVRRDKLYETKTINVSKDTQASAYFVPRKEPLEKYLDRGVNFLTLNVTHSVASQTSFGLTYGQVKKFGWFASVMTGLDFTGFSTIDKSYNEVALTGESRSSRLSVTAGLVARLGDTPLYAKAGAGYGMRIRACETISGEFAEYTPNTYKGVELTAGLQFNLNKLTLGIDVLTTSFKYTEIKLGIGVNWN